MVLTGLKDGVQPWGMFERFTDRARHAVVLAQEEAGELDHIYIGTEHLLLGLLREPQGVAARVLAQFGMTLDNVRAEVAALIGRGKGNSPGKHIPFTPRAKKSLELALREALALHHNYIGTEHLLLGLIRDGDGVAAKVMREHADLVKIRLAVLNAVPPGTALGSRSRSWLRRLGAVAVEHGRVPAEGEDNASALESVLGVTPAADNTLTTASRLAGGGPVGSHHLLLAALTDAESAAALVLTSLGVDITRAKDALLAADITGTSDEQPEDAGRRQLTLRVTGETVTITATDKPLVQAANSALTALGEENATGAAIRGASLEGPAAASLAKAWQSLHDAFTAIATRAAPEPGPSAGTAGPGPEAEPGRLG
jgi:ATP-dependent Clp protease ATP-binding subunit ClpA